MMKKRKSIAELIDGILDKRGGEAENLCAFEGAYDSADGHLARLGAAFLARLNIPEGMDESEAAERIITMWNDADEHGRQGESTAASDAGYSAEHIGETVPAEEDSVYGDGNGKREGKLPSPIRGGLFEAPRADYESMSAEQFRRLKKQLERASMDGRRIRL